MVCALQVRGSLEDIGFGSRSESKKFLEMVLREELEDDETFGYVFVDRGTFSKALTFLDPTSLTCWSEGETSKVMSARLLELSSGFMVS